MHASPQPSEPQAPPLALSAVETQATALRVAIADKGAGVRRLEAALSDMLAPPGGVRSAGPLARIPMVALQLGSVREHTLGLVGSLGDLSEAMAVRPLGAAGAMAGLKAEHAALARGGAGLTAVLKGLDAVQVRGEYVLEMRVVTPPVITDDAGWPGDEGSRDCLSVLWNVMGSCFVPTGGRCCPGHKAGCGRLGLDAGLVGPGRMEQHDEPGRGGGGTECPETVWAQCGMSGFMLSLPILAFPLFSSWAKAAPSTRPSGRGWAPSCGPWRTRCTRL